MPTKDFSRVSVSARAKHQCIVQGARAQFVRVLIVCEAPANLCASGGRGRGCGGRQGSCSTSTPVGGPVAGGVRGDQRPAAVPGAQQGVRVQRLATEPADRPGPPPVQVVDHGHRELQQHVEHLLGLVGEVGAGLGDGSTAPRARCSPRPRSRPAPPRTPSAGGEADDRRGVEDAPADHVAASPRSRRTRSSAAAGAGRRAPVPARPAPGPGRAGCAGRRRRRPTGSLRPRGHRAAGVAQQVRRQAHRHTLAFMP